MCCFVHYRGRVCCHYRSMQGVALGEEILVGAWFVQYKSKHNDVRYHWMHDALDAKLLELAKVHTDDNGADMMTKAVLREKFEACCEIVGLAISPTAFLHSPRTLGNIQ
ncbi:hypothetical protein CR513_46001, partial [Mucuna pruriens]